MMGRGGGACIPLPITALSDCAPLICSLPSPQDTHTRHTHRAPLARFKPAPLYILDEVDSALDLNNSQNIGRMIKQHFPQSQVRGGRGALGA